MSNEEEIEQPENYSEMSTEALINILSHHRIHDATMVAAAAAELDTRRSEQESIAELEGLIGVIKAANRKVMIPIIVLLLGIGSFVSWSYHNQVYQDFSFIFLIAGAGLVMLAVKMMEKRPYIEFHETTLDFLPLFGTKFEVRFDEINAQPIISGKKMRIVTDSGERNIDLSPLTPSNRTLFINTLTARLNTQRT
jgi:hypothetical protein